MKRVSTYGYRLGGILRTTVLAASLLLVGCKEESVTQTPSPATSTAAPTIQTASPVPTAPPTAEQVIGFWVVKEVAKLPAGLPESWRAEFTQQSLLFRPDKSYFRYTHLAGQSSGVWSIAGDVVTLKPNTPPGGKTPADYVLRATANTLTASDESAVYAKGPDAAPLKATADELGKAFEADKKAGGAKFGGKQVELEGVIGNLNGRLGSPFFSMLGNAQTKVEFMAIGRVQVQPVQPNPWTVLWVGQPVKVTGWCAAEDPYLYFAEVQLIGPSRVAQVAATDLASQWRADAKQTIEKYIPKSGDAPLLLTGKLLEVKSDAVPSQIVIGEGDNRVECGLEWIADLKDALKTLKFGDSVQVVGVLGSSASKKTASIGNGLIVWK